tara:strand:+ start:143 stop:1003 length:861 start_codon:yes stop_codon:yes gene_type:complete
VSNQNDNKGILFILATPIGNLKDITLRAIETLQEVDLIAAEDTRRTKLLLTQLNIKKPMISYHDHNEESQIPQIMKKLLQGQQIALVSDAGTPLISDPGFKLVLKCSEYGIKVSPIPGPSALIAALSVSGLPTSSFKFEGFLPRKKALREKHIEKLQEELSTLIFYESSHRIEATLNDLGNILGLNRKAVVARELTKLHETIIYGDIGSILSNITSNNEQKKGEFVILVAGKEEILIKNNDSLDFILPILMKDLSVRQAAHLAAKLTGANKNYVYECALKIKKSML